MTSWRAEFQSIDMSVVESKIHPASLSFWWSKNAKSILAIWNEWSLPNQGQHRPADWLWERRPMRRKSVVV